MSRILLPRYEKSNYQQLLLKSPSMQIGLEKNTQPSIAPQAAVDGKHEPSRQTLGL
jgi:hypothetical protein